MHKVHSMTQKPTNHSTFLPSRLKKKEKKRHPEACICLDQESVLRVEQNTRTNNTITHLSVNQQCQLSHFLSTAWQNLAHHTWSSLLLFFFFSENLIVTCPVNRLFISKITNHLPESRYNILNYCSSQSSRIRFFLCRFIAGSARVCGLATIHINLFE